VSPNSHRLRSFLILFWHIASHAQIPTDGMRRAWLAIATEVKGRAPVG